MAVSPPLLSDVIARLLARADVDVVVLDADSRLPTAVDLALISGPLPLELTATVSVELPDDLGNAGTGRVHTATGDVAVELGGFEQLAAVIDCVLLQLPGPVVLPG